MSDVVHGDVVDVVCDVIGIDAAFTGDVLGGVLVSVDDIDDVIGVDVDVGDVFGHVGDVFGGVDDLVVGVG